MDEYVTDTCVRGFHVYQDIWSQVIGEELPCEREEDNDKDRYAVVIIEPSVWIVEHVPRYMSRLCSVFIWRGGKIYSIVTDLANTPGIFRMVVCTSLASIVLLATVKSLIR